MGKIKAVVFDMDGTLFTLDRYFSLFFKTINRALNALGVPGVEETQAEMYPPFRLPLNQSREYVRNRWGVDPEVFWERFIAMELDIRKGALGKEIKAFDCVRVLKGLAGTYKIGLMSNTPLAIAESQLRHYRLMKYFDAIVCGDYKCEMCKPETRGLELCLERLGVKPEEAVMVGDADIDIEVGKALNTTTVQVIREHSHHYPDTKPDFTIHSLEELEGICQAR